MLFEVQRARVNDQGNQFAPPSVLPASLSATHAFAIRHPFVPLALAYAAGVLAGWQLPLPLAPLFLAAGGLILAAVLVPRARWTSNSISGGGKRRNPALHFTSLKAQS